MFSQEKTFLIFLKNGARVFCEIKLSIPKIKTFEEEISLA